jgi:hypothetical protein
MKYGMNDGMNDGMSDGMSDVMSYGHLSCPGRAKGKPAMDKAQMASYIAMNKKGHRQYLKIFMAKKAYLCELHN